MADRLVLTTIKDAEGDVLALCHDAEPWSPRSTQDAIEDITSGRHRYQVPDGAGGVVAVDVVDDPDGAYLRTAADGTTSDNLDALIDLTEPGPARLGAEDGDDGQHPLTATRTGSWPFPSGPVVVFVGDGDRRLWQVGKDGSDLLNLRPQGGCAATPWVRNGVAYFAGRQVDDGYVLSSVTLGQPGTFRELATSADPSTAIVVSDTPFATDDAIYYSEGGSRRLMRATLDGLQADQVKDHTAQSTPWVDGSAIFFRGTDDTLWRHDMATGDDLHLAETNDSPCAPGDGRVYFRGTDDRLLWVEEDGGHGVTWIGGVTTSARPSINGDTVFFRGTDSTLWRIQRDGSHLHQVNGNTTGAGPVYDDGALYFRGTDSVLWVCTKDLSG